MSKVSEYFDKQLDKLSPKKHLIFINPESNNTQNVMEFNEFSTTQSRSIYQTYELNGTKNLSKKKKGMNINSETHYHDGGKQVSYTLSTVTYEYLYLFLKHHLELNG